MPLTVQSGFWIPNVTAAELPGTRQLRLEMTNQETGTVELVIPEEQLGLARFYGLINGGAVHPQHATLHIASIDVFYDYPKEFEGNTLPFYQDDLVKLTLHYKEWQLANQGYESTIENIGQVYTLPLRGLFWSQPNNNNVPNYSDPVLGNVPTYLRRGNLRIVRNYTNRTASPMYIMDYHNTINTQSIPILEWGKTVGPGEGMFTCGSFKRQKVRDYSSSDPAAQIDLYSYSYSIEIIEGTWNSLHHPYFGKLMRLHNTAGQPVSFYPESAWNLVPLLQ